MEKDLGRSIKDNSDLVEKIGRQKEKARDMKDVIKAQEQEIA